MGSADGSKHVPQSKKSSVVSPTTPKKVTASQTFSAFPEAIPSSSNAPRCEDSKSNGPAPSVAQPMVAVLPVASAVSPASPVSISEKPSQSTTRLESRSLTKFSFKVGQVVVITVGNQNRYLGQILKVPNEKNELTLNCRFECESGKSWEDGGTLGGTSGTFKKIISTDDIVNVDATSFTQFPDLKVLRSLSQGARPSKVEKTRPTLLLRSQARVLQSQKDTPIQIQKEEAPNGKDAHLFYGVDPDDDDLEIAYEGPKEKERVEIIEEHYLRSTEQNDEHWKKVASEKELSSFPEVVASFFRKCCVKQSLATVITGSHLKQWIEELKELDLPAAGWLGLTQATMRGHKNVVWMILKNIVDLNAPLIQEVPLAIERLKERRGWRASTTLKNATSFQGALSHLPLYWEGCPSIFLSEHITWKRHVRNWSALTKQEQPKQARPASREDVERFINRHKVHRPHMAVAIMIGWLTAARLGCILQLEVGDVICEKTRLAITFRRGKGVKVRGPYTVDTQPLPTSWFQMWTRYLKERKGNRLFPASIQGYDLCKALQGISEERDGPRLEQRSIRRGALQTMAANGVDEETLMRFSGHTQVNTLRRYLNWNVVNKRVQDTMAGAASSLIPQQQQSHAPEPQTPPFNKKPPPKSSPKKPPPKTRTATRRPAPKVNRKATVPKRK